MAQTLVLPTRFFDSDGLPEVCLFSGRTDNITERSMSMTYMSQGAQLLLVLLFFVIGILVLLPYFFMRKVVTLHIPQAPGAKSVWGWKRQGWLLPFFFVGGSGCVMALVTGNSGPNLWVIFGLVLLALGVISGVVLGIWGPMTSVRIRLVDADTVELKFPNAMTPVYEAYEVAFQQWRSERKRGRSGDRKRGLGGDSGDESWADDATAWDSGKA
ncbi:MAG: hypothetical protein ACREJ2_00595 [Planctomycetota bacterium]